MKFALESKQNVMNAPQIKEMFPDVIEQIRKEINGTNPTHTLPMPPEHFEVKSELFLEVKCWKLKIFFVKMNYLGILIENNLEKFIVRLEN